MSQLLNSRSRKRMNVVPSESSGRKQVKRSDVSRPTKSRACREGKTVTMKTGSRSVLNDNPQPSTSSGISGSSSANPVKIEDDDDLDIHLDSDVNDEDSIGNVETLRNLMFIL